MHLHLAREGPAERFCRPLSHVPMTRLVPRLGAAALLLVLLAATAVPASAQRMRTERVRFTRGASAATLRSTPRQGRPVRYLIGASAGQTLTASAIDVSGAADCYVQVYAPGRALRDGNAAPNAYGERYSVSEWSGRLSRSGDYQVLLINTQRSGTCGVTVSVY